MSGEKDHTSPRAINDAIYKRQLENPGVTESIGIPNRGHGLTVDDGWHEVAHVALEFVKRFA